MKRLLAAALLLLAACGGGGGDDDGDAATSTTTSTTAASVEPIDWRDPAPVDVDGWHLESCDGDAPVVCVDRDGEPAGIVEMVEFPVDSFPALEEPLAAGDEDAALDALAESFVADLTEDRSLGCGDGYVVEGLPIEHVTTGDGPAVRYGLVGTTADGATAERVVQYAAIRGETLVILLAAAYSAEGCIATEGQEFSPDDLEAFEPTFDRLVLASPMPAPTI